MRDTKAVIISIHPEYVDKIISGEKRVEFRRSWAVNSVDWLVIYATSPVKRVMAVATVGGVHVGSKTRLWNLAKRLGGGVSRRCLFQYLDGKKSSVAIELIRVEKIENGIDPVVIFGPNFRPPQSFRYLTSIEYEKVRKILGSE